MAAETCAETVYEGRERMTLNYEAATVGLHSEPLEYPAQQVADEMPKKVGYWDDLEKDIPGVESDFHTAIFSQFGEQPRMGRAAVLRMSHPYTPDGDKQTSSGPRRIKWKTLRDTAEHAQSSTPAASDSESAESPEGILFEDLDLFKEALKIFPRHYDESTVPQFFDRQLIVLEDLGRDWVETIGELFHVPPYVFALHWASPSLYKSGRAHVPLGQPAEEHFVLPYSEMLPFEIKEGKDFFKLDCCPVRFVSSDMQQDQNADQGSQQESEATNAVCEAMISYWGRLGRQKEWTAILLVDPQPTPTTRGYNSTFNIWPADANGKTLGDVPLLVSRNERTPPPDPRPAIRSAHGRFNLMPVILKASLDEESNSTVWTPFDLGTESTEKQVSTVHTAQLLSGAVFNIIGPPRNILRTVPYDLYLSILDQILRAPPPKPDFHPVHATKFVRRIVLAKTTLIVDTYLRETYTLTVKAMQNISKIADFDPQRLREKPWQDEWRSEFFNRLWELRGNIELLGFDMENTIRLFSDLANNDSWPEMKNLDTAVGRESQWDKDKSSGHIKIRDQDAEDLKEWERLEATRKYAAGFIERTTNSYLQAATAEGAKFANIQARTSKKMTL